MSTAEITAYLFGVDIGRQAEVITAGGNLSGVPDQIELPASVLEACGRMTRDEFRGWLLRGVGDAWKR